MLPLPITSSGLESAVMKMRFDLSGYENLHWFAKLLIWDIKVLEIISFTLLSRQTYFAPKIFA